MQMIPSAWMRRVVLAGALLSLIPTAQAATNGPSPSEQASSSQSILSVAPSLIKFPAAPLGAITSQTVRVVNSGQWPMIVRRAFANAEALTVSGLSKPIVLAGGEALNLTVAFRPAQIGKLIGKLTLIGDAGGLSTRIKLDVNVSGEAVESKSELSVDGDDLDFGTVQAGSTATKTVRLTNTGNRDVQIASPNISRQDFSAQNVNGTVLAAGQSAEIQVNFHPTETGSREATLVMGASGETTPVRVALHGEVEKKAARPITLHWQEGEQSSQGYFVYRGTAMQGPFEKLNSVPVTSAEYTDESLSSGRQYFYVVTSVNENGDEGPFSEPIVMEAP